MSGDSRSAEPPQERPAEGPAERPAERPGERESAGDSFSGSAPRPSLSELGDGEATAEPGLYARALKRWAEKARARTGSGEADALAGEVETYLEELQVAEEELKVQTEELESALTEAERQRRRYRELFDHAPIPYLATDAAGAILEANREAGLLLGVDPKWVRGKPLSVYLAGESDLRSRISRLAAGRRVQPWESAVRPRKGDPVPVEVSARSVQLRQGEGLEIQWMIQDVRARRAARERDRELQWQQAARGALEQVAERARLMAEVSGRLMGVLDPTEVWKLAAELAGQHATAALVLEPVGEETIRVRGIGGASDARRDLEPLMDHVLHLREGDPSRLPLRQIRSALERGEPEVIPAPQDPPDSAGACLVVSIRSGSRPLGVLIMWLPSHARIGEELVVARNLADRVGLALESAAMFQEVVRARREAEEATTAEADFLSVVSHELRTPLTAIVSYAELLEDRASELPEKLERYAHQIAAAADHQRHLVEQILTYKQVQRKSVALQPEDLDYRKVARSAVAMVQPQTGDRPVQVEHVVPAVPVRGVSDRGKLQQILTNLLSNALRHTPEGHVRLTLETQHQWVVFKVEDTGEGIPAEDLPRIFDRFWRGTGSGRDRGGSGLGLTITRELVERLRGDIQVESESGVGTTFTVRIPRVGVSKSEEPRLHLTADSPSPPPNGDPDQA